MDIHALYERLYFKLLDELPPEYASLTRLYEEKENTIFDPISEEAFKLFEAPYEVAENPFYYKEYVIYFDEAEAEVKDCKMEASGIIINLLAILEGV